MEEMGMQDRLDELKAEGKISDKDMGIAQKIGLDKLEKEWESAKSFGDSLIMQVTLEVAAHGEPAAISGVLMALDYILFINRMAGNNENFKGDLNTIVMGIGKVFNKYGYKVVPAVKGANR